MNLELTNLAICPFCKSDVIELPKSNGGGYYAWCVVCNCRGPFANDTNTATEAWNAATRELCEIDAAFLELGMASFYQDGYDAAIKKVLSLNTPLFYAKKHEGNNESGWDVWKYTDRLTASTKFVTSLHTTKKIATAIAKQLNEGIKNEQPNTTQKNN